MTCGPVAMHMANELLSIPVAVATLAAAVVTMAAILVIQCLLFQDGGLLALGCNILNMAVVSALSGHLVYRFVLGRGRSPGALRHYASALLAVHPAAVALRNHRAARSAEP